MAEAKYVIGVDLGTTNCALAFAPVSEETVNVLVCKRFRNWSIRARCATKGLLPSFLYIPGASEFPSGSLALPWNASPPFILPELWRGNAG